MEICVVVADIDCAFKGTTKQDTDDAFAGVLCVPVVVVDDAQKHQRVEESAKVGDEQRNIVENV